MSKSLSVIFAFTCLSAVTLRAEDTLESVAKSLKESQLAEVNVFGAPEIIESNEAVSAKVLATVARHRSSFIPRSSAWRTRSLVYCLQSARPIPANSQTTANGFDFRWGCILQDQTGSAKHQVYLDGWKNEGLVDGQPYAFSPKLRMWFYIVTIGSHYWGGLSAWIWIFIILIGIIAIIVFFIRRIVRRRKRLVD